MKSIRRGRERVRDRERPGPSENQAILYSVHREIRSISAISVQKLSRRLSSLENKTALSKGDKAKAREILSSPNAVEYMSSEESDPGDTTEERSRGPKPRKIRKLSWERSKLKNIKEILDECYFSGLNAKQSPRPCPVGGPNWAIR
ncbi:hypothetical protein P5673_014121, partial [Acropora cervicornis]